MGQFGEIADRKRWVRILLGGVLPVGVDGFGYERLSLGGLAVVDQPGDEVLAGAGELEVEVEALRGVGGRCRSSETSY